MSDTVIDFDRFTLTIREVGVPEIAISFEASRDKTIKRTIESQAEMERIYEALKRILRRD